MRPHLNKYKDKLIFKCFGKMYQVKILIDDEWRTVPLAMCSVDRNCGCLKDKRMDVCDYTFHDTESYEIAKSQKEHYKNQGYDVKIIKKKVK